MTNKAAEFFAEFFDITVSEAKSCNQMTIECMVKFTRQYNHSIIAKRLKRHIKEYNPSWTEYDIETEIKKVLK